MKDRIEAIRTELKSNKYDMTKVLNYTSLGMERYFALINDKNVDLTEDEIWCLEVRLFKQRGKMLK